MLGKETETGRAFGALLTPYRLAGLTQEVLTERAGLRAA
jgi:hypothetical protein